jgi:hypothetical protein
MNIRRMMMTVAMAVAVGGTLAAAPPAVAATPSTFGALVPSSFVEFFRHVPLPESSVQDATAVCPAGSAAVSVGGGGAEELIGITPGPAGDSGVATGRAGRGQRDAEIIAQVTCAPIAQFAGTTVATRQQSVHSDLGEWTQTVTCPAGMRAVGGGGYFKARNGTVSKDEIFMSANSLTVNGRGWTVSAVDNTFTDTLVVTTRCAAQSSSTRLVEETYPIVPPRGSGVGTANGYAHCPAGFLPISGGAQITQDGTPLPSQSNLQYSVSVPRVSIGWFGSGSSGGEHAVLHVIALCGS